MFYNEFANLTQNIANKCDHAKNPISKYKRAVLSEASAVLYGAIDNRIKPWNAEKFCGPWESLRDLADVDSIDALEKYLLDGAANWLEYVQNGHGVAMMGADIRHTLIIDYCTAATLKKFEAGQLQNGPRRGVSWMEFYAQVFADAWEIIRGEAEKYFDNTIFSTTGNLKAVTPSLQPMKIGNFSIEPLNGLASVSYHRNGWSPMVDFIHYHKSYYNANRYGWQIRLSDRIVNKCDIADLRETEKIISDNCDTSKPKLDLEIIAADITTFYTKKSVSIQRITGESQYVDFTNFHGVLYITTESYNPEVKFDIVRDKAAGGKIIIAPQIQPRFLVSEPQRVKDILHYAREIQRALDAGEIIYLGNESMYDEPAYAWDGAAITELSASIAREIMEEYHR